MKTVQIFIPFFLKSDCIHVYVNHGILQFDFISHVFVMIQCVSVGYFVMGLVWKYHTGVIDDSWIRILNRLWIGNLRLGATINGLVLTSVCLFPFYIVSGSFGLMGIFCRKRTFLTLVRSNTTNATTIKAKLFLAHLS